MLKDIHAILASPRVSGVDENNNINKTTLTQNIIVLVPPYNQPSAGDDIVVNFGTHSLDYLVTTANVNNLIMVEFAPADIETGSYDVSYTVTDITGNHSTSTVCHITVSDGSSRPSADLLPLAVEGMVAGQLDLSALADGKVTVDLPSDNGNLAPGDDIIIFVSQNGVIHSNEHIVVQNVNPHHVAFNASLFSAGAYQFYYTRNRNGDLKTSSTVTVTMVTQAQPVVPAVLMPPIVPQAVNGIVSLSQLTEDVVIEIPRYQGIAVGDIIQVSVGDLLATPHIVVQNTLDMHYQTITPDSIRAGSQAVSYSVTRSNGSSLGRSPDVVVTFVRDLHLLAPQIVGAQGNKLSLSDVKTDYVEMDIPAWAGICRGDTIHGFIGTLEAVPHIVVQDALDQHILHFDKMALSAGQYKVYYRVVTASGYQADSPALTMDISDKPVSTISKDNSYFRMSPASLQADGMSSGNLLLILKDSSDNTVKTDPRNINLQINNNVGDLTLGGWVDEGVFYRNLVIAGKRTGTVSFVATVEGITLPPETLTLNSPSQPQPPALDPVLQRIAKGAKFTMVMNYLTMRRIDLNPAKYPPAQYDQYIVTWGDVAALPGSYGASTDIHFMTYASNTVMNGNKVSLYLDDVDKNVRLTTASTGHYPNNLRYSYNDPLESQPNFEIQLHPTYAGAYILFSVKLQKYYLWAQGFVASNYAQATLVSINFL